MATYLEEILGISPNPNAMTFAPLEYTRDEGFGLAIPSAVYDAINALASSFALPGDVYAGNRQPTIEDATEFALSLTGAGGVASAPANSLRSGFARINKPPTELPIGSPGALSNTKYQIPLDEMQATFKPTGLLYDFKELSPVDLYGGGNNVLIPFVGDKTRAGGLLTSIGGKDFDVPVNLQGGFEYAQSSPNQIWASAKPVTTKLQNQANRLGEEFEDVIGGYTSMRGTAADASHHMYDAVLEQMKTSKIKKTDKKEFDEDIKKLLPNFPGIDSPKLKSYLKNATMPDRVKFNETVAKAKHQKAGFPNIEQTRFAITHPSLIHSPSSTMGPMFAKMKKGAPVIDNPDYVHETYPTAIQGEYLGGLLDLVPHNIMLRDWAKSRNIGDTLSSPDQRSLTMSSVYQPLDQQWLDETMSYIERLKGR